MVAGRTKILLQIVVRPWHVQSIIAVKQAAPVIQRHFIDMCRPSGKRWIAVLCVYAGQQSAIALLHGHPVRPVGVGEHLCRVLDPGVRRLERRPEVSRREQAIGQDSLKVLQFRWESPFFRTRANDA